MGMNPVDTLGMRVLGVHFEGVTTVPPPPTHGHPPPGGKKGKQNRHGALTSIPKLIGLYRPNSLTYGSGNDVTTWKDSSGHLRDMDGFGSPGSTWPIQNYDASIANNYIDGNGSREGFFLDDAAGFFTDKNYYTVYAVVHYTFGDNMIFWSQSQASGDTTLRLGIDETGHFKLETTFMGAATANEVLTTGWHYIVYIQKGANVAAAWVDGKKQSGGITVAPSMGSETHMHLASGWYQVFGGYPRMTGKLSEIAIWNKAVNTAERQTIESHAKFKFKL